MRQRGEIRRHTFGWLTMKLLRSRRGNRGKLHRTSLTRAPSPVAQPARTEIDLETKQQIQLAAQALLRELLASAAIPRADQPPAALSPRGLSREAAAAYCGISPGSFDKLVAQGTLPGPWLVTGVRRKLWDKLALDKAFDAQSQSLQRVDSLADYLE